MYTLPEYVTVNSKEYKIRNRADYRTILGVIDVLNDPELTKLERVVSALIIFYDGIDDVDTVFDAFDDIQEAIKSMFSFISCGDDEQIGVTMPVKLIDWQQDEKLIISAINRVANTEVRSLEYLHWWTFIGYYMAIGDCPLSQIVSIRDKIYRHKKLEKYEEKFRRENPQYFRWKTQDEEGKKFIEQVWNRKGD